VSRASGAADSYGTLRPVRILLADDERAIAVTLRDDLERAGHRVVVAKDGDEARGALAEREFDVVVTDMKMPGATGIQILEQVKRTRPETEVVIITGYGTIESAVDATKKGAFEYVLKPFDNDQILVALRKIEEFHRLRRENVELRETLGREKALENIVGRSAAMEKVLERVRAVAESDANVLITGESGTGKERIARAIHDLSRRRDGPFVALACAAVPAPLLEDEIFGHERGAFTDAKERKLGRFERADGGTIFLDDIDDMPLETQVKLLRVLQERQFERLGGEKPVRVDVRVVAATKVDLGGAVEDGEFREDLYYRLNVVPLSIPPLRERTGDVPPLVDHFLRRHGKGQPFVVPPEVLAELSAYRWPGNVRELENAVERAVALAPTSRVLSRDVLLESALGRRRRAAEAEGEGAALVPLKDVVREAETRHVRRVLAACEGHRAQAAKVLGISRKNLWEKMKEYGIE
jgi:two-component system response regulator HydG